MLHTLAMMVTSDTSQIPYFDCQIDEMLKAWKFCLKKNLLKFYLKTFDYL